MAFKRKTCLGISHFVFRLVLVFKKDRRKADQLRFQAGRAQGTGFYTPVAPPSVRATSIGATCWMVAIQHVKVSEVRELEAPQTCVRGFCPVLSPYPGLLSLGCCPWAPDKQTWLLFFPVLNSTFLFGLIKIVSR